MGRGFYEICKGLYFKWTVFASAQSAEKTDLLFFIPLGCERNTGKVGFSSVSRNRVVVLKQQVFREGMKVSMLLGQKGLDSQVGAGHAICAEETK